MFGENHILVKAQMAPRRSAEPGNPEWKRAGLQEEEEEGSSFLTRPNSGRKHMAELKHSDRHFFKSAFSEGSRQLLENCSDSHWTVK